MTQRFFDRPSIKNLGIVGFFFLLGLALGNGWATTSALKSEGRWYQDWCGQQVAKHHREDVYKYGW